MAMTARKTWTSLCVPANSTTQCSADAHGWTATTVQWWQRQQQQTVQCDSQGALLVKMQCWLRTSKRRPPALSFGSTLRLSSLLATLAGNHLLELLGPDEGLLEMLLNLGLPNPTMPPPAPVPLLVLVLLLVLEKPPE